MRMFLIAAAAALLLSPAAKADIFSYGNGVTYDNETGITTQANGDWQDAEGNWHMSGDAESACGCYYDNDTNTIHWRDSGGDENGGGEGGLNSERGHGTDGSNDRSK